MKNYEKVYINYKKKLMIYLVVLRKKTIKHVKLIPLNLQVFIGCKIQALLLDKCAISIYHRNPKYKLIVVVDNILLKWKLLSLKFIIFIDIVDILDMELIIK